VSHRRKFDFAMVVIIAILAGPIIEVIIKSVLP
jgi:hypothetical protein